MNSEIDWESSKSGIAKSVRRAILANEILESGKSIRKHQVV